MRERPLNCLLKAYGPLASEDALTITWEPRPVPCDIGRGNEDVDDLTARQQIVALDIDSGEILDWNPKSNAAVGVLDIKPVERGLLLGQDNDRINDVRTGNHAFLDFGSTTPPFTPPGEEPFSCSVSVNGTTAKVEWTQ